MNKQELIKRIEVLPYTEGPIADTITINRNWILESIEQLDESETGHADEAPRYVKNVLARLRELPLHDREVWLKAIMGEFEKDFSHAKWREGHEVEKEKKYIVTLKSSGQKLYYHTEDEGYIFSSYDGVFYSEYHTKTDLEENGMSWVFDCEGVEVEEVE